MSKDENGVELRQLEIRLSCLWGKSEVKLTSELKLAMARDYDQIHRNLAPRL